MSPQPPKLKQVLDAAADGFSVWCYDAGDGKPIVLRKDALCFHHFELGRIWEIGVSRGSTGGWRWTAEGST